MSKMSQRVLVLNKKWHPIGTTSLNKAILMVWQESPTDVPKAKIIEPESYQAMTWLDWAKLGQVASDEGIRSANAVFRIPEVILLTNYDRVPNPAVHFSRRNLFKRDSMTCQYCGCRPGSSELTIDHVLPKAQGGTSTWENCILACIECNGRKANRTPEQAGMKLRTIPVKPKIDRLRWGISKPPKSWMGFVSECYWNVDISDHKKS